MPHFQFVGIDTDGDGIADHLDEDDDNDGILDGDEFCLPNPIPPGKTISSADYVYAIGRVWAQADLFLNVSYEDIAAVCHTPFSSPYPEFSNTGVCCGSLNGYDITGWKFARTHEAVELLNSYGVNPPYS